MEGADRVESVAMGEFPVDGEDVTGYLAGWIGGLRTRPALQGVILGGITVAGLAVVDVADLAERLGLPVLVVTRRSPLGSDLAEALRSAGLDHRLPLLQRVPRAFGVGEGLYLAHAGTSRAEAERLVLSCLAKDRNDRPGSARELARRLEALDGAKAWDEDRCRAWWDRHKPASAAA